MVWMGVGFLPKVLISFLARFFSCHDRHARWPEVGVARLCVPFAFYGSEPDEALLAISASLCASAYLCLA